MTDEEIEKALHEADDMAINENVDCSDVYNYIWCLKNKCDRIRKETAKEILFYLYEKMGNSALCDRNLFIAIARTYGVEVE